MNFIFRYDTGGGEPWAQLCLDQCCHPGTSAYQVIIIVTSTTITTIITTTTITTSAYKVIITTSTTIVTINLTTRQQDSANRASFTLDSLEVEAEYQLQLQARNSFGWGKVQTLAIFKNVSTFLFLNVQTLLFSQMF